MVVNRYLAHLCKQANRASLFWDLARLGRRVPVQSSPVPPLSPYLGVPNPYPQLPTHCRDCRPDLPALVHFVVVFVPCRRSLFLMLNFSPSSVFLVLENSEREEFKRPDAVLIRRRWGS